MTNRTDTVWWNKWDNAAKMYDFMNGGVERRYGDKSEIGSPVPKAERCL